MHVDDRFGPPPEWNIFDTTFLFHLEKIPLVAHVNAVSEEEWIKQFVTDDRHWPKAWMKDPEGHDLEPSFVETLYAAFNSAAEQASAMVFYLKPEPEYASIFDSRDARVWIWLRMADLQLREWNELWARFLSSSPPACALTIQDLYFAKDDSATAATGHPTWKRFVESQAYASSETYELRLASSWEEIQFTR